MGTFLKMIGSGEHPCPEPDEKPYVDFSRRPNQVHPGDHLVLYACGGRKRVFALAEVTSEAYDAGDAGRNDGDERWPYRVDVKYLVNLPPSRGVHIDEVSTSERDLKHSLRRLSYLRLKPEEYGRAATRLRRASGAQ